MFTSNFKNVLLRSSNANSIFVLGAIGLIFFSIILFPKEGLCTTNSVRVSGQIADSNGAPVAGATVNIRGYIEFQQGCNYNELIDLTAITDSQGYYGFQDVPAPSILFITVEKDGYETHSSRLLTKDDDVEKDIILASINDTFVIKGIVVDNDDFALLGATVHIYPYQPMVIDNMITTYTDEDGLYSFNNVPIYEDVEAYIVIASLDGYKNDFKVLEDAEASQTYTLDLTLQSLYNVPPEPVVARVEGVVTDIHSNPIPMAIISIYPPEETIAFYQTLTDIDGKYVFPAVRVVSHEAYVVKVEKEDYETVSQQLTLFAGQTNWLDFILENSTPIYKATVQGTVTDIETGDSIEGVQVKLRFVPSVTSGLDYYSRETITDRDGYYVFEDIDTFDGHFLLHALRDDYVDEYEQVTLEPDEVKTVDFQLHPKPVPQYATVQGTVTDIETEEAISETSVTIISYVPTTIQREATTDTNGFYIFEDVPADGDNYHFYTVSVEKEGYLDESHEPFELNTPGEVKVVDFQLTSGIGTITSSIKGTVTDKNTGEAISDAAVELSGYLTRPAIMTYTDIQGGYVFENVTPSYQYGYSVKVSKEGYITETKSASVPPGVREKTVDFELPPEVPKITLVASTTNVNLTITKDPSNWLTYADAFTITNTGDSVTGWQLYNNQDGTYTPPGGTPESVVVQGFGFYDSSGGLAAGESRTVRAYINNNKPAGLYKGSYKLQEIRDGRATDVTTIHYALEIKEAKPDLIVTDITWFPEGPEVGDEVTFQATIRNQGESFDNTFTAYIELRNIYGGIDYSDTEIVSGIPKENEAVVSFSQPWMASEQMSGNLVTVYADKENVIDESDETNNSISKAIMVTPLPPLPRPQVTVSTDKSSYLFGEDITITVSAYNPTSNVMLLWFLNYPQVHYAIDEPAFPQIVSPAASHVEIQPGLTHIWTLVHEDEVGLGNHTLNVRVGEEPYGDATTSFTVIPQPKPDLTVAEISWSPANPVVGDEVSFQAVLRNTTGVRFDESFIVYIYIVRSGGAHIYSHRETIHGRDFSEDNTVVVNFSKVWVPDVPYTGGNYASVNVQADPYNAIDESDEHNNIKNKAIRVTELLKPDLYAEAIKFYKPGSEEKPENEIEQPMLGERVIVKAILKNIGQADIPGNSFSIRWTKVNTPYIDSDRHLNGLSAGEISDDYSIRFEWIPTAGETIWRFESDYRENEVSESNEDNNITERRVVVTAPNHAPKIEPIADKEIREGQRLRFTVSAEDPDGDHLADIEVTGLPGGAEFEILPRIAIYPNPRISGEFRWTPGYDQAGEYEVEFKVSDGKLASSETVRITVVNENLSPVAKASANPTSGESPLKVQFFSDGSDDIDGEIVSYYWDFGDRKGSSEEANPKYTYKLDWRYPVPPLPPPMPYPIPLEDYEDASGGWEEADGYGIIKVFTATLTVTDDDGATTTDSVRITVESPLYECVPKLEIVITDPRNGATVYDSPYTVRGIVEGIIGKITVTVNGVKAETEILNQIQVYPSPPAIAAFTAEIELNSGENIIEAIAKDSRGMTARHEVKVVFFNENAPPVAKASANPTHGPSPLKVQFSSEGSYDIDGKIVSYHWDFGDGQTSTEINPTHTYEYKGRNMIQDIYPPPPIPPHKVFTATLTVADDQGAKDADKIEIKVSLPFPSPHPEPRLEIRITEPEDGAIVHTSPIEVRGEVTGIFHPGLRVHVNGVRAKIRYKGYSFPLRRRKVEFTAEVPLRPRRNTITAVAVSRYGAEARDEIHVLYEANRRF